MTAEQPIYLNSFGRRNGRKLRANRSALMETLLPKLLIELPIHKSSPSPAQPSPSLPSPLWVEGQGEGAKSKLWFEIGFGGGEHLVHQARLHPEVNFIGCEPFVNGMASLLAAIEREGLTNIRLYDGDARLLLERLPDGVIERLFVLFPDPWPKARHHKRRIISQDGLSLFHKKMKPGALLRIATDHVEYGVWILEKLLEFQGFIWNVQSSADWNNPPAEWIPTRYQEKALVEGRKAMFLNWIKPE